VAEPFDVNAYIIEYRDWVEGAPFIMPKRLPPIECTDGLIFSMQADKYAYCTPRSNYGPYAEVEIGFPIDKVQEFMPYAEDPEYPINTVYGYVPVEIVEMVVDKHNKERRLIWSLVMFGKTLNIWWRKA